MDVTEINYLEDAAKQTNLDRITNTQIRCKITQECIITVNTEQKLWYLLWITSTWDRCWERKNKGIDDFLKETDGAVHRLNRSSWCSGKDGKEGYDEEKVQKPYFEETGL